MPTMNLTRSSQVILYGAILALVVVGWIVLGLVGAAGEAIARWSQGALGVAGPFVFGALALGALTYFSRRAERRHDAAQYAADRTIHVEKPVPIPTWRRVYAIGFWAFVLLFIAGIMWADPTARPW